MNNIPANVLERGLRLAETSTVFGVKLREISYEELLALAAVGWHEYSQILGKRVP